MKTFFKILLGLITLGLLGLALGAYLFYGQTTTNIHNYASLGDIPTPMGYHRISGSRPAYSDYLRSLPLKERGAAVELYTGGPSHLQSLAYAVVDLPLLSNAEQCADVCMRLRAEYLYNTGQYGSIRFQDVNGHTLRYQGGASRKALDRYLRNLYGVASTFSMSRSMPHRELKDMEPGDVFVYAAGDHTLESQAGSTMGHAIMVVDVAENDHGEKVYMLAEGNTPARSIHILRNWLNPIRSPWFKLDADATQLHIDCFYYNADELHYFE